MWRTPRICGGNPLFCGANCGNGGMSNFLRRTPCAAVNGGHRTLPPSHQREGRKAGTPGVSGIRQERRSTPRGNSRHRPGDGVGGVAAPVGSRRDVTVSASHRGPLGAHTIERPSPHSSVFEVGLAGSGNGDRVPVGLPEGTRVLTTEGSPEVGGRPRVAWCSYHQATLTTPTRPPACRWKIGAELERRSAPRGNSRRRPGDGGGGVRRTVRSRWASPFPPQSRGPLDAHTIKRPSPFSASTRTLPGSRTSRNPPRTRTHTVHVPETPLTLRRVGPAALRAEVADTGHGFGPSAGQALDPLG
jgi:hypothetical protein